MIDAVAYDHGDERDDLPDLPRGDWYRERFQQRLEGDYAKVRERAGGLVPVRGGVPGRRGSRSPTPPGSGSGPPGRSRSPRPASAGCASRLNFAYDMRRVLESAATDFRRLTLRANADAATSAALADLFRRDRVHDHLTGKGLAPQTYDAWLDRRGRKPTCSEPAWPRCPLPRERQPAEFGARAAQATDALIREYQPRVATAGEVARRRPGLRRAVRGRGDQGGRADPGDPGPDRRRGQDRFRTLDALDPGELGGWRDWVVAELTDFTTASGTTRCTSARRSTPSTERRRATLGTNCPGSTGTTCGPR